MLGSLIEHDTVHLVFLGHLHRKESEEQDDVLATLTQGRHLDGYRVQSVVEILAESAFADGLEDIHVGSSHDAHIGLTYLCASNGDIFARLKHTQQSCLSSQRQLANLVEKQCALVGHAEVTRRVIDRTCIRTLNMSEEL